MKTITYTGAIVLPTRDSIFLYEVDSTIRKFLDSVIDANVTKKSIDHSIGKIADQQGIKADQIKEFAFNKTTLLMLKSFSELAELGVINLNEVVSMNSQYEEVTKLKAIKAELSAFRSTPYSDMIIPVNVKIDGAYIIQVMLIVIYAPADWSERNASIAFGDQQALEQAEKIKNTKNAEEQKNVIKQDDVPSVNSLDSIAAHVMQKGVGSSRNGTIETLRQAAQVVHPFEMNVINSAVAGLRKMVTNKTEMVINEQNAIRFMDIKEYFDAHKEVSVSNDGDRFMLKGNKLVIRTTSLGEIANPEYITKFKNDNPVTYVTKDFKIDNEKAMIIYAPPGAGKTEFIVENNLTLLALDTDYTSKQEGADLIITNRHELIPKFAQSCAIIYGEQDWMSLVRSKMEKPGQEDPIKPEWYKDMMQNADKATFKIQADRGKYISDYVTVMTGIDSVRKEVILTPTQINKSTEKAESLKEDSELTPSSKQKHLTEKLTSGDSVDDTGLTDKQKSDVVERMSTPAQLGMSQSGNKNQEEKPKGKNLEKRKASSLRKGTDNFFK